MGVRFKNRVINYYSAVMILEEIIMKFETSGEVTIIFKTPDAQVIQGVSRKDLARLEAQPKIKVMLECPVCMKQKVKTIFKVSVPAECFNRMNGIATIIAEPLCKHKFAAYVDVNGKVRGYGDVDLSIKEKPD